MCVRNARKRSVQLSVKIIVPSMDNLNSNKKFHTDAIILCNQYITYFKFPMPCKVLIPHFIFANDKGT